MTSEVTFEGYIVVPNTDIKTFEITPNAGFTECKVSDTDIVIHAIYVSHDNPSLVKLTLRPKILVPNKDLEFIGYFKNTARALPFSPPIGVYKQGLVMISVEATGMTNPVYVAIQYSVVGGG